MEECKGIAAAAISDCMEVVAFELNEYDEFCFAIHSRGIGEREVVNDILDALRMMFENVPQYSDLNMSFRLQVSILISFRKVLDAVEKIVDIANSKIAEVRRGDLGTQPGKLIG